MKVEAGESRSFRNPAVRKLLNESHGIFHKLQNLSLTFNQLGAEDVTRVSLEYRSCLRSVCLSLQDQLQSSGSQESKLEAENLLKVYKCAEMIWSLAEIIFLRPRSPAGSIVLDLIEWGSWNFTLGQEWTKEIASMSGNYSDRFPAGESRPENHPNYWNAIYHQTLLGKTQEAITLLRLHIRMGENAFKSVEELLRKIPVGLGIGEELYWRDWQEECYRRLTEGEYSAYPQIQTIVKILCGRTEVFSELESLIPNWYELLIPLVIYTHSDAQILDLKEITEEAVGMKGLSQTQLGILDSILFALLELDCIRALKEMSAALSDWWVPAHLSHLLYIGGTKDLNAPFLGGEGSSSQHSPGQRTQTLKEFLIINYAQKLAAHPSLWQLSVEYYKACSLNGKEKLKEMLGRLDTTSDVKIMKIIRLAEENEMPEVARALCNRRGQSALNENEMSVALGWCLQSKDPEFGSMMAEKCLEKYNKSGLLHGIHLLDQIGDAQILSPSLLFLGKYRDFHKVYSDGKLNEAANLLCELLKSQIAPKFWITLLIDAMPMLSCDRVIFNTEQTHVILGVLDTMSFDRNLIGSASFWDSGEKEDDIKYQMNLFRAACLQNLANALSEGCSDLFNNSPMEQ